MIYSKIGYSYNDLTMVPAAISTISSRKECSPLVFQNDVKGLPIFASPMATITNEYNLELWKSNNITPVIPRNIGASDDISERISNIFKYIDSGDWVALSLNEFKYLFIFHADELLEKTKTYRICVDLANGHMKSLYEYINRAKNKSRELGYTLVIMTGNIANPKTYEWIAKNAEVDYIRLSIGTGANCITSTQTSIHYPIATLIQECYELKRKISKTTRWEKEKGIETPYYLWQNGTPGNNFDNYIPIMSCPALVADGGIRGYSDVIKAIGLGADYVMVGSVFTGLLESAAPLDITSCNSYYQYSFTADGTVDNGTHEILNIWQRATDITPDEWEENKKKFIHEMSSIIKESYGMSTKKAQRLFNPSAATKTSEGCTKYITVKETIQQWSKNMFDYFKSAMSYTNSTTLGTFRGKVDFIVNSAASINAVNK